MTNEEGQEPCLGLAQGDITTFEFDAIVNAANSSLMGGGGVDGAIHRAGGPAIRAECEEILAHQGRLPTGRAVITTGGNLPARYVIHTVGPVWRDGTRGEPELLASCYRESLRLSAENGLAKVAFPSISTGAYGYPVDLAAPIALGTVEEFLRTECAAADAGEAACPLRRVTFVLFDADTFTAYERAFDAL